MLGQSDNLAVRLGGIHLLARLAKEHPNQFHLQVMEVFGAYVTDQKPTSEATGNADSPEASPTSAYDRGDKGESVSGLGAEVSAMSRPPELPKETKEIMRIIAERDDNQIALETKKNFKVNLKGAYLAGLFHLHPNFSNINFTDANLCRSTLSGACFNGAILDRCDLSEAKLIADFRGASLLFHVNFKATEFSGILSSPPLRPTVLGSKRRKASTSFNNVTLFDLDLRDANLSGIDMREARLCSAVRLDRANLSGTDLTDAYIVGVTGLTKDQLDEAIADPKNPPHLKDVLDSKTGEYLMWSGQSPE